MKAKTSKSSNTDSTSKVAAAHAERVSKRAYEIWEACGCPHGCDTEHWLQSEQEIQQLLKTV